LKQRELFRRTVSLRLTAWYCGFFVLSLLTLFCVVYFTLATNLQKKDFELIRAKLREFSGEYKENGLAELRKASAEQLGRGFFVRAADARNQTLLISNSEEFEMTPQLLSLIEGESPDEGRWLIIPLPDRSTLEIANTRLRDGNFLQVGRNSRNRQAFLHRLRSTCAAIIFPMIVLAMAGGALLAHRALAPIRELSAAVHAIINTGKMDQRISPRKTSDELRDLVVAFNQMIERIDALIQGMRGVLDNVAHDLRTPLTRLRGMAEIALQNPQDIATAQEALADCVEESERVITMLNTLMDISEVETGSMRLQLSQVRIDEIVAQVVDLYRDVAEEKNISVTIADGGGWVVTADENRLRQAIGNLLDNALKYTPNGGAVGLETQQTNGEVIIGIRDSGLGIAQEEIPHVWERLYRGDKSRSQHGLGLGLSLVKAIAQAHAGRCEVESAPGAGSLFRLHLPVMA
ncbi:MAG: hypothetical protein QOD99_239, partial [Chthoniobacter sp.]|nr:hypothetical protein [Chthoniobacter sp.]